VVTASAGTVRSVLSEVNDPEIPVLSIDDLGILRDVRVDQDGHVEVDITPTYSGCPAIDVIRQDIEATLQRHGYSDVIVRMVLSPAWTTDWMSEDGRRKLREYGIAPPGPAHCAGRQLASLAILCPQCGSAHTQELSRFGSTPCKALRRCTDCREPFDHFKPH
jgi:ring-1,2-phenylacetyl-CoA epoxidase subunit PaaD